MNKHNGIAQLFRDELASGWDAVIYRFAAEYHGGNDSTEELRVAIRQKIAEHRKGQDA